MKVTIIRADNFIGIDGRGVHIDMSQLPSELIAVQFSGENGVEEWIETTSVTGRLIPYSKDISSLSTYQEYIDTAMSIFDAEDNPLPPSLEELRQMRMALISRNCGEQITAGVTCNALGAEYIYPTEQNDQLNLSGSVARAMLHTDDTFVFSCTDHAGVKARIEHTAEQIIAVGDAVYDHVKQCLLKKDLLFSEIEAAIDEGQVAAVSW